MKSVDEVLQRTDELRDLNDGHVRMRQIIRAVLNGGADAVAHLVAESEMEFLPGANLIHSGIERVAQKLLYPPTVRVDSPVNRDNARARRAAEKRERIVEAYDRAANVKMQVPQAARWIPGYGFCPWVIQPAMTHDGQPYPQLELRDPFNALPGPWTVHQQPDDIAFIRRVPEGKLRKIYPNLPATSRVSYSVSGLSSQMSGRGYGLGNSQWAVQDEENLLRVIEYRDHHGTYMVLEEANLLLDFEPTPMGVGTNFVIAKRFAFDKVMGQFDHVLGLQQMMVRMNILAFLSVQDAVFAETNIYGEMVSDEYRRGRGATNVFDPGTRVERPTDGNVFQSFQQIDRLERQLRLAGSYPVTDDAQSPNSYVTGRGLQELTSAADNVVQEYQLVMSNALEIADTKRLCWDDKMYGELTRTLPGYHKGAPYVENYKPATHIKGNYNTRRIYGILSGLDSSSKLVGLLQISQAGWLDDLSAMENIEGIDNVQQVRERVLKQRNAQLLEQAMMALAQGQQMDPRVLEVLIDGLEEGPEKDRYMAIFFPEPEQEMEEVVNPETGETEQVPAQQPLAAPGEDPTTILSRLFSTGSQTSAAQTVQTVG